MRMRMRILAYMTALALKVCSFILKNKIKHLPQFPEPICFKNNSVWCLANAAAKVGRTYNVLDQSARNFDQISAAAKYCCEVHKFEI